VDSLVQEAPLDCDQEVVRQYAQKDMRLDPVFELMEDGPLHEGALHGTKCRLDAGQQDVSAPDLVGRQVLTIGLEEVGPVQALCPLLGGLVLDPGQTARLRQIVYSEVPGDA
jgi:hypothetical protein